MRPPPPPPGPDAAALEAFGLPGRQAVPLPGGQGQTWRAGDIVLKPADFPAETRWRAQTLAALEDSSRVRVARPVQAVDADWVAHGWEAFHLVAGEPDVSRIDDILAAGDAFHALLAAVPRPSFLDTRDDPWTYGDAVAWEELPLPDLALLEPLAAARRPATLPSQIVHGDLAGNVLFADPLPPAVIDWPVYWRPPSWALAVAVVDVVCWEGAPVELIAREAHRPAWGQMLIRALIYRIATEVAAFGAPRRPEAYLPAILPAIEVASR